MSKHQIKTRRLLLRRWRDSDLDAFSAICADPEVMKYIGDGTPRSVQQSADTMAAFEAEWEEQGFGLFAVELLATYRLIGFAGLAVPNFLPEILPSVEIGWRLSRDVWGQGYATEAAHAALEFGTTQCGLHDIVSIYQVGNGASKRIMQKLGMKFDRTTRHPNRDVDIGIYRLPSAPSG